jgi:uncharacterized protein (TIRG00374 family)
MKTILRLLISAILIGVLLITVDLEEVIRLFSRANLALLLIACLWAFIDRFIMIYRWALLLNTNGAKVSLLRIGQIHFMSSFLGNFIPFSMAPDVLRAYSVSKHTGDFIQPFSSTMIDRLLGLLSLSMIAFGALWGSMILNPLFIGPSVYYSIIGGVLVLGILVLLLWNRVLIDKLLSLFRWPGRSKGFIKIMEVYTSCLDYKNHKDTVFKVLGLCFINQIGAILMTYVIALALHVDVAIIYFFLFVPIISFLNNLPASFNGVGVYEAGTVYLFSVAGVSMPEALAMALLGRLVTLIATLPGGVIYAVNGIAFRKLPA